MAKRHLRRCAILEYCAGGHKQISSMVYMSHSLQGNVNMCPFRILYFLNTDYIYYTYSDDSLEPAKNDHSGLQQGNTEYL